MLQSQRVFGVGRRAPVAETLIAAKRDLCCVAAFEVRIVKAFFIELRRLTSPGPRA